MATLRMMRGMRSLSLRTSRAWPRFVAARSGNGALSYPSAQPVNVLPPCRFFSVNVPAPVSESIVGGMRVQLDAGDEALIEEHRDVLRSVLHALEAAPEPNRRDIQLVRSEVARLSDGFFLLVVAGEYNSGKSSLINALVGKRVLAEGPTPTTAEVTKLRFAESPTPAVADKDGVVVIGEPVPVLASRLQIVDTPGTNAIDRAHEALTREFFPLCDLVLFVTSADRPFSESERLFLENIRTWGKKVVLIVNKMDLLDGDDAAKAQVINFVRSSARSLLGSQPRIFALSSRMAQQAKASATGATGPHWDASGFASLEDLITETLDSEERLRLKLNASAAVGNTVANKHLTLLSANKVVVDADLRALSDVHALVTRHEETVRSAFPAHYARVDNALLEMLERADLFFDSNVRLSNIFKLGQRGVMAQSFENEVVQGTAKAVQRQAQAVAEWLADKSSRNLADATAVFMRRIGEREREISTVFEGGAAPLPVSSLEFHGGVSGIDVDGMASAERLLMGLSDAAMDLSAVYESKSEGTRIANEISSSVTTTITMEVGALGIFGALLTASSLDPAGLASSGLLASAGLFILPRRRRTLRAELRSRVAILRKRLEKELKARVDEQVSSHVVRIQEAMEPFARFTAQHAHSIDDQTRLLNESLQRIRLVTEKVADQATAPHGRAAKSVHASATGNGSSRKR